MAILKNVVISWRDQPETPEPTLVSIDEMWNSFDEEDDSIAWYFASEDEYKEALKNGTEEFTMVELDD